ncbi:E3 ubiquitin-protein ligase TRIM56-like, partial [Actinia tenebrosa]
MAAIESLEDIIDTLEEQLTCSLCHDVLTQPKTLSCLHSYCARCIAPDLYQSGNRMDCPFCNTTVVVPDGDPSKLPSSFYLDSLLDLLHAMKSIANEPVLPHCVSCEQPRVLVAFCQQCNGLICEACCNAHRLFREIRDEHQPIMLDPFREGDVNSFIKTQMLCKCHERKKLEYYCQEETCRLSVCQKCATLNHLNHQLKSLEDAGQDSRNLIEGAVNRVEQRKQNDGQELKQSKENIERIQREIDVAKKDVQNVVKMICKMAKEHGIAKEEELNQTLQE